MDRQRDGTQDVTAGGHWGKGYKQAPSKGEEVGERAGQEEVTCPSGVCLKTQPGILPLGKLLKNTNDTLLRRK